MSTVFSVLHILLGFYVTGCTVAVTWRFFELLRDAWRER